MKNRRNFIKGLGAAGLIGSTLVKPNMLFSQNVDSKLNLKGSNTLPFPVNVSEDRVIRTAVGLRPYRPSGYLIKKEKIGEKEIIHNYGHGGGGISLSWGTATLAVNMISAVQASKIAVLGCGVIGLSTAILLQRRGFQVTIYSKQLPPDTVSNVAGALWAPVSVFEPSQVDSKFIEQFNNASQISQRMFQDLVGERYGVWWIKNYFLGGGFRFPGGKNLYPGFKEYGKGLFDYSKVEEINTLMIEPPIYLNSLLDDFYRAGGEIKIVDFRTTQELMSLEEAVIMNCTGLGSKKLFNDSSLTPVKGQLSVLLPQPEIDYSYIVSSHDKLLYMFPRKDGIILGGTSEKGNWSLDPSEEESSRIIKGHSAISEYLKKS
ncbi:FAD-dependent oxidoreductase [Zobellia sp. B3R18]|uniref:FAD-dependent oxidoreductase n=1 Tax=Zobellia sp. B3R18 TaxID=2841568 RepID=UPI001C078A12|nr:FAD-dependent oxidoreductase [Zobellia sp. B3R18]MBU2973192.1 FAD-binding oxidoreductase [Zobellia sp. B3R18]